MDDRISELLAQYDLDVYRAGRVKGAWLLETNRGLKSLGVCSYSEGKIRFEQKVKQLAVQQGFGAVDLYVPNREQSFLVQGPYNEMFVMRDWFQGEECTVKSREHVLLLVETLARLHNSLQGFELAEGEAVFCLQPRLT